MTKVTPSLFLAMLLALGLHVVPAQAQLSRTAVSTTRGDDANNCGLSTPCRTFQRAHDATNDQGEITVLDPGGYGSLNITKSISIVNDGVGEASILVSGGATGITVNNGTGLSADIATLRAGQSTITGNGNSWTSLNNGIVQSFGDNYIAGNDDGDPAPPTIARK